MVFCFSLGTVYVTRNGRINVFGTIDFGADALFIIALFVVVMAVVSPFVVLQALGRWTFRWFSSEGRHRDEQVEKNAADAAFARFPATHRQTRCR